MCHSSLLLLSLVITESSTHSVFVEYVMCKGVIVLGWFMLSWETRTWWPIRRGLSPLTGGWANRMAPCRPSSEGTFSLTVTMLLWCQPSLVDTVSRLSGSYFCFLPVSYVVRWASHMIFLYDPVHCGKLAGHTGWEPGLRCEVSNRDREAWILVYPRLSSLLRGFLLSLYSFPLPVVPLLAVSSIFSHIHSLLR